DRARIGVDERDHLGHGAIAVGIVARVAEARQPALPVGRQQPERVPALGAPRVGDLAALEHDVIDAALAQAPAHGEAGVPGADDDAFDRAHGDPLPAEVDQTFTATVTLVGLVTTSYTAERFCDCATRARISSGVASASMSKVTLMPSKPLRTSVSMPRMPWRSIEPSMVAATWRSWMLRCWATAAMPAVRQAPRPTSTYSTGVAPLSSAANSSG